ncbi:MAG TPA: hypothetical protein VMI52_08960 [Acetobacteraceae bacterium]|nr:hypothetical protein [Acetobacteraceae bacterium]
MKTSRSWRFSLPAICLLAAACVTPGLAAEQPDGTQLAREHQACAVDMGYMPNNAGYEVCVSSLRRSLAETKAAEARSQDIVAANARCEQQGLQPGMPAFANCVLGNAPQATQ